MLISGILLGYATLCLAHLGLQIILAYAHHRRGLRHSETDSLSLRDSRISVIYPVYNESPDVLRLVLDRARRCLSLPGVEVIVVDDGSSNRSEVGQIYSAYACERIKIVFQNNRGKREAQYTGLQIAAGEYIVTVDSDTLIAPEDLLRLIAPLVKDARLGAVCGDVRVQNASTNLLTRLIAYRYWTAFNLERAAQSYFRCVLCCSGPLSAYRASILHQVKDAYVNQTFFGRRCTYGDDRHLTNLVLGENREVIYQPEAVGWTFVPETIGEYIKQQNRWNKSFYREMLWTIRIADRVHLYALVDMLLQPLMFVGFTVALSYSVLLFVRTTDLKIVVYYLTTLVMMASTRTLYGLLRTLDWRFTTFVLYGFLHVFALIPVRFKSILTLTDNHWGTRTARARSPLADFLKWAAAYMALLAVLAMALGTLSPGPVVASEGWALHFEGSFQEWLLRLSTSAGYSFALTVATVITLALVSQGRLRHMSSRSAVNGSTSNTNA